jgi:hypothetical protein
MSSRQIVILFAVAVFALGAGLALGVAIEKQGAQDISNALRGADFHNRLSMIRLFREKAPNAKEIVSMEISAIALLAAINFEEITPDSSSAFVLRKSADTLLEYRQDFPKTEFDPSKHKEVEKLLSLTPNKARK